MLLFCLIIDIRIHAVSQHLPKPFNIVRASADDLAFVMNDVYERLPGITRLYVTFARASVLYFKVKKCIIQVCPQPTSEFCLELAAPPKYLPEGYIH